MSEKNKILVTGATGFVGDAIVSRILAEKHLEVVALTGNKTHRKADGENRSFKQYSCDITDSQSLKELLNERKIDIVIHCAGLAHQFNNTTREEFFNINVKGTENICRLAGELDAKRVVLISTVAVYGKHGKIQVDEKFKCQPLGFYAESKYEAEQVAAQICQEYNIDLIILRLGTVIGEGDKGNFMRLIKIIEKGNFIWIGNGKNKKSLIYKKDVAEAIIRVIEHKRKGSEIYNLTTNIIEMETIVELIAAKLEKKIPKWSISPKIFTFLRKVNGWTVSNEKINNLCYTVDKWISEDLYRSHKFIKKYDFESRTSLEKAIDNQISFYLKSKPK